MINYNIIYTLLAAVAAMITFITIGTLTAYLKNKADFRAVNIVQFVLFGGFLMLEATHYLYTGEANQMCILLTRNFLLFSLSCHLNCKLIGYRNVFTSKKIRNILYIVSNTLVYFCITCICLSYLKVEVNPTPDNSIERLLQISRFMEIENYYPKFMSFIPIIYCLFACISIIYMDFKEKRNLMTKASGIMELIPLMIFLFDSTPMVYGSCYILKIILSSLYFIIPTGSMFNEAINIIYFSAKKNDDDIKEMINKSFRENRNKITNAGKVQAKLIAKEIQKNEELLWMLPKGKRDEKYKMFIINLLEDPE